ncbi:MAG: polysaccharide biosynthesis C-terminal domain-containing protein [Rhodopila sp.]
MSSYAITVVIAGIGGLALWLIPLPPEVVNVAWMGLPLLVLRSVVSLNQAVNRSSNLMARFNWIECIHSLLGLALGLSFTQLLGPAAQSVMLGLLIAAMVCAVADLRLIPVPVLVRSGWGDGSGVRRLVDFAWPLVVAGMTTSSLQLSDRFVVGGLGSAEMLGIYTVAYSLVERPIVLICASISTSTYVLAVQALERQGRQAASVQAGKNGAVLLALALPACVGLAMTSDNIAAVLVGPAFRAGVAALIPIMGFTALFRSVRWHFVDHAFHLAARPKLMLWSYAPSVAANIVLNVLLVPRYGAMGAAWSGLLCQVGATVAGWLIGQRVFPLWLPPGSVLRIVIAVLPMALVLWVVDFPQTWLGLAGAVTLGVAVYGLAVLVLDIGGIRSLVCNQAFVLRLRRAFPRWVR